MLRRDKKAFYLIWVNLLLVHVLFSQIDLNEPVRYFQDRVGQLELDPKDVTELVVTDQHQSAASGVTHFYLQQFYNGIKVRPGLASVHYHTNGDLLHVNNNLVKKLTQKALATKSSVSPERAIKIAAGSLQQPLTHSPQKLKTTDKTGHFSIYSGGSFSREDIPVSLVYQQDDDHRLRLTWETIIHTDDEDVWMLWVDANDGKVIKRHNQTRHCHFEADTTASEVSIPTNKYNHFVTQPTSLEGAAPTMPLLSFNGQYRVFAPPLESPIYGSRTLEPGSALIDPEGSPFGWHDIDGNAATVEYDYTRGNNAYAYYDPTGLISNPPPLAIKRLWGIYLLGNVPQPAGGSLNFNYQNNIESLNATSFLEDAITNLFVWNNIAHDVFYRYGFDEAAGNFQQANHTGQGLGGDYVLAEAQDGGGTDNATFQTPPDGENPTMRMFLWTSDLPNSRRDGSFDNVIMVHEYGHGVAYRLIGGPSNVTCLLNNEQGGEGWSDFFGLLFTLGDQNGNGILEEDVVGEGIRSVGNYVMAAPADGVGIRPAHYSTNMDCSTAYCNDYTYGDLPDLAVPHGVGFLWCSMLWDMTWNLIDQYGFEPDIYNADSHAGNIRAMKLVVEALKFTPCEPTFTDMRDAILAANTSIYEGEGEALIWEAFAQRGLGFSATAGGNEAFDNPYLKISKNVNKEQAENGEVITYTISVKNNADALLTNAVISDVVAPNLDVIAISDGGTSSSNTITYPGVDIVPGATVTRTFSAIVDAPSATSIEFEDPVEALSFNFLTLGLWLRDGGNPNPATGSTTSWWHLDAPFIADGSLVLNLNLDGSKNNHLSFWHYYDLERNLDGAVIEVLDGLTWVDLSERIIKNSYNGLIHAALPTPIGLPVPLNTLNGRRCFTGYSGGYINTMVDLSGFEGPTKIRFRVATNESNSTSNCDNTFIAGCDGWYLDDFKVLNLTNIKNRACVNASLGQACADVGQVGTIVWPAESSAGSLMELTAHPVEEGILVNWPKGFGTENGGYELQRNSSAEAPDQWTTIGQFWTVEEEQREKNYRWVDTEIKKGIVYYYRLQQQKANNSYGYSQIASAAVPQSDISFSVYPNPAKALVTMVLENTADAQVKLSLYTSSGKWIKNINWSDSNTKQLVVDDLSAGLYFIQGMIGDQPVYEKLIIQQ